MPPSSLLAKVIHKSRLERNLTQDEYGVRNDNSGPAVFKFEKGYIQPSFELRLRARSK